MKHRTLIIIVLVLSLLMIPVNAKASTIVVNRAANTRELVSSSRSFGTSLADIINALPEGHHDNFAGIQSPFFCRAEGWAADPDDRTTPLQIRIFSDGVEVAQAVADTFRPDLADAGVCLEGNCSFSVNLWGLITPDVNHLISVEAQDAQTGEWGALYDTPKTLNCFTPQAGTFIVNSTEDGGDANPGEGVCETFNPGECTLRAAIMESNANPGADTINFNIPGAGPFTISPTYGFDFIFDPVAIDATTQPGFAGTPIIELEGSHAGPDAFGIVIYSGSSTVRGLAINRFALTGVDIDVNGGNTIQGNYIGTDLTGTVDLGNGVNGIAISQGSGGNLIGGTTAGTGNIISGNNEFGIIIVNPGSNENVIQGNFIGTDVTGSVALGNHSIGIVIGDSASDNVVGGEEAGSRNLISGNGSHGVQIDTITSTGNLVQGNYIGTDATGTLGLGNADDGVLVLAPNNIVGGTTPASRNIISGNQEQGIRIAGSEATGNTVQGNFIGTDVTGLVALSNGADCCHSGIVIHAGASNNVIGGSTPGAGNIISGNTADGVTIIDTGTIGNVVAGNFIGTDVNGTTALANDGKGVAIFSGATNNLIGGTSSQARNVISGNSDNGVVIYGESASNNRVQGNYIGTDVSGTFALGNTGYGIFIGSAAADNIIGGLTPGAGNLISGNSEHGIGIFDLETTGNVIQGNKIGTDLSGESALANSRSGVAIGTGAAANIVGGLATGAGNIIAFNNENGVLIYEGPENGILSNSIYANTGLGIDLADDGVTRNDLFDSDDGPNNLQNFPILNTVKSTGKGILIQGALLSTRNTTFRLEFFSNAACNPSGYGEGQTYLGSVDVKTNSTGHVNFKVTLPVVLSTGRYVTATATDPANNTSEFSSCVVISP